MYVAECGSAIDCNLVATQTMVTLWKIKYLCSRCKGFFSSKLVTTTTGHFETVPDAIGADGCQVIALTPRVSPIPHDNFRESTHLALHGNAKWRLKEAHCFVCKKFIFFFFASNSSLFQSDVLVTISISDT